MVDLPAALDEGMWEMHKLQMVGLRNLPCGGLGPTNQEAATRNPYGREPLDSARDMYREGQESKLSGDLLLDHTPVDEYGVPLLETIAEASKELSAQSSAGTVSSFAAPRPPCTKSKPIHARKSTKPTIRNLETLDEMINEGKADQHRSSRSVKMLEAEMEASCGRNPRDLTGANGRYWTTTDGQKYKGACRQRPVCFIGREVCDPTSSLHWLCHHPASLDRRRPEEQLDTDRC